ncbi:DNA-binding protein [Candidatus Schmidhempelia bombi str. Bimp]|uniref:DNA-binding protein n=2 Tax=Orbales TaxID=1240482 RepID=A0AB94ICP1_9GAMM|nr:MULTISPECIES: helix-turn-helix domain-containing protein [Orbaceae]TEA27191.1 DNA-binding protein [Candidatus Schmidhempelia bombi str. Bimp]
MSELQEMTQLCRNTLMSLANKGEFHVYKLGERRIAFKLEEIEDWLTRCKVKPISNLTNEIQ